MDENTLGAMSLIRENAIPGMACFAIVRVVLVMVPMAIAIPTGIVDVVETMRAVGCARQTS